MFLMRRPPPESTRTDPLVPYTTLFRSAQVVLIVAPEKRLLQEFFLTVDKDSRSRGCHLAVSTYFREFKELSLALGKTFFPAFDPDLHDLNPDHVFWLALRQGGENGPLIAIQAGKQIGRAHV